MTTRVLLTAQSDTYAGVERRLLQEICVLRSLGAEVTLAPSRFPQSTRWSQAAVDAGARLISWNPYKFIERQQASFPWPQLSALSHRAAAHAGFALAHVAMTWTTVGLSRVHALAAAGVPVVLGLHCTYDRANLPQRLTPHIQRAFKGVVGAYAVSACSRDSFLANFGPLMPHVEVPVIHNGIDTQRFVGSPAARIGIRLSLGIPPEATVVVFCGRLDDFKNPLFAVDAYMHAAHGRPDWHLLILGDGPLHGRVAERAAANEFRGRIHLSGFVEDVRSYLSAADVYLSTSSSHEGFPLAPSEALACGLPIVVPEVPVFQEAFGRCAEAELVRGLDTARWAQALGVVAETLSADKRAAAREFALQHLDVATMRQRLATFYRGWLR